MVDIKIAVLKCHVVNCTEIPTVTGDNSNIMNCRYTMEWKDSVGKARACFSLFWLSSFGSIHTTPEHPHLGGCYWVLTRSVVWLKFIYMNQFRATFPLPLWSFVLSTCALYFLCWGKTPSASAFIYKYSPEFAHSSCFSPDYTVQAQLICIGMWISPSADSLALCMLRTQSSWMTRQAGTTVERTNGDGHLPLEKQGNLDRTQKHLSPSENKGTRDSKSTKCTSLISCFYFYGAVELFPQWFSWLISATEEILLLHTQCKSSVTLLGSLTKLNDPPAQLFLLQTIAPYHKVPRMSIRTVQCPSVSRIRRKQEMTAHKATPRVYSVKWKLTPLAELQLQAPQIARTTYKVHSEWRIPQATKQLRFTWFTCKNKLITNNSKKPLCRLTNRCSF